MRLRSDPFISLYKQEGDRVALLFCFYAIESNRNDMVAYIVPPAINAARTIAVILIQNFLFFSFIAFILQSNIFYIQSNIFYTQLLLTNILFTEQDSGCGKLELSVSLGIFTVKIRRS